MVDIATYVILDTNALRDDLWLRKPNSQRLISYCVHRSFPLVIPHVVHIEAAAMLERDINIHVEKLHQESNLIKSLSEKSFDLSFDLDVSDVLKSWHQRFESLQDRGVLTITNPPNLNLDRLINDSVRWKPPFQAGDRGFKDALIWDAVRSFFSLGDQGGNIVVISNDSVFEKEKSALKADLRSLQSGPTAKFTYEVFRTISEFLIGTKIEDDEWDSYRAMAMLRKKLNDKWRDSASLRVMLNQLVARGDVYVRPEVFGFDPGGADALVREIDTVDQIALLDIFGSEVSDRFVVDVKFRARFISHHQVGYTAEEMQLLIGTSHPMVAEENREWVGLMTVSMVVDNQGLIVPGVSAAVKEVVLLR